MTSPELAALAGAFRAPDAAGEARRADLGRLRSAIVAVDRSHQARPEAAAEAHALWDALVSGACALVESFEADGRRYLLVRASTSGARDRDALTPLEARALLLRAQGASFKLIAAELGLSAAAAHGLVRKGKAKLGIHNEHELPAFVTARSER